MAKVLCVLYDDPVSGYPPVYARDNVPRIERYFDGQTTPTRKGSISSRVSCSGVSPVSSVCVVFSRSAVISSS